MNNADNLALWRHQERLNAVMASELTALRAIIRAIALQPGFDRTLLHAAATTLLDAALAEFPPELQDRNTFEQAQYFVDSLLVPPRAE